MFRDTVRSLLALAALTIICGVAYPLVVWGDRPGGFSDKADGSLVHATAASSARRCSARSARATSTSTAAPSAVDYDASGSGGSNLGPNSAGAREHRQGAARSRREGGRRVRRPGAGRPRDRVRLRPRPGHLAAGRADPGRARGARRGLAAAARRAARAQPRAGPAPSASSAAAASTCSSLNHRARRTCARNEPRARASSPRSAAACPSSTRRRRGAARWPAPPRSSCCSSRSPCWCRSATDFDTGTIALVLLLPPLVAANGGRRSRARRASVSALTFNFLFTRPVLLVPHRVGREHRGVRRSTCSSRSCSRTTSSGFRDAERRGDAGARAWNCCRRSRSS